MELHPFANTMLVAHRAVKLTIHTLDGLEQKPASGFIVREADGLFLYTCWHVVTGVNFLDPSPIDPPPHRCLAAEIQAVEDRNPSVRVIGGGQSIDIQLYDKNGQPRWLQEPHVREQPDLKELGLFVPKFFDIVRLPIELDKPNEDEVAFESDDIGRYTLFAGDDVVIMGFPHGYTATRVGPDPIFLKRSIAAAKHETGPVFLDGGGSPGMSGAPVLARHQDRWWLYGMYTGILHPDYAVVSPGMQNDRFAALGLMVPLWLARAFMKVPGMFEAG